MKLVIDANIVMAGLLRDSVTRRIIITSELSLYSPPFLMEELDKHWKILLAKSGLTDSEFAMVKKILLADISIIQKPEFDKFLEEAKALAPDYGDVPYFALALLLNCALWSNDKRLKQQPKVRVYSTEDLAKLLRD